MERPFQRTPLEREQHGGAAQLRAEFDRSFALPAQPKSEQAQDFVIIEVAGREFALAARELSGVERIGTEAADRAGRAPERLAEDIFNGNAGELADPDEVRIEEWVGVPSSHPSLLGIRAFQGRIVPGFSLAQLLGFPRSERAPYCVLVASAPDLAAFAFDALLRFTRIEPDQKLPAGPAAEPWQQETIVDRGQALAVISIAALLESLAVAPPNRTLTSAFEDLTP